MAWVADGSSLAPRCVVPVRPGPTTVYVGVQESPMGHSQRNREEVDGSLPKLGSYSLINLLVRNFNGQGQRSRKKLA